MKKNLLFLFHFAPKKIGMMLCVALCIFHSVSGQQPLVKKWDHRFGGDADDIFCTFQQTTDGGYILGGSSVSGVSGDKSQPIWNNSLDFWIVKTDSFGIKQWDKDIGGLGFDALDAVLQTSDGGYMLGGHSMSGIGGDKSEDNRDPSNLTSDYWVVRTDSLGNKLWDKRFGGTGHDGLASMDQTSDGGFILGGYSMSGVGGDKTQPAMGTRDYWVVKIDSLGNKQWDKVFGGNGFDALSCVQQTHDHGFILGGFSSSGIGGNKTQNTWGAEDYWIIKIDSLGNQMWDKDLGGYISDVMFSLSQTFDGGFILGGYTNSGIGGDKTQPGWGALDFWIVKTDSLGNKEWDKDLGGTDTEDEFCNIVQTSDGGYLMAGTSYSPIGGDKSEDNLATEQTWVIKIDATGNKTWDKTLLTDGHNEIGFAIQSSDGCYVMANGDNGGIAGNRSEANQGNNGFDYWMIKFCDSVQTPLLAFTSPTQICPGTCVNFLNLTYNATSYQWSFPGGIPSSSTDLNPSNICYATPGTYGVQLIAANAAASDTITLNNYLTVYPFPAPQGILQNDDTLFANQGATSYQWYFNGSFISGATDYFYIATSSGDYNVVATDANGCEVEAVINNVLAHAPLAVGYLPLAIYPNPVFETIDVRGLGTNSADEVLIYNVVGEKVFSAIDCKLPIANCQLSPGMYYIEINTFNKTFRSKFLKQ